MESLLDELLASIFHKMENSNDRKSFSLVCKNWLRLQGLERLSLRVVEPDKIPNFLPRFPNLLKFRVPTPISNSLLQFVANSCPKIQVLNLSYKSNFDCVGEDDVGDEGISDIAKVCRDLETVILKRRSLIGDLGVFTLLGFSKNLRNLDLGFCSRVSDEAIRSIGDLEHLESLSLQGCVLITDCGLAFLAKESSLCKTLKKLNLAKCNQITDKGLVNLRKLVCLEELTLSDCGPNVTNRAIVKAVSKLGSLKKLNLAWLEKVTGRAIDALARGCLKLEMLNISGCRSISPRAIRAFAGHGSLDELIWADCHHWFAWADLDYLVTGCTTLDFIVLGKKLLVWLPVEGRQRILRHFVWANRDRPLN